MIVLNEDSIRIVTWDSKKGIVPVSREYSVTFSYTKEGKERFETCQVKLFKTNNASETKTRCISAINSKLGV